MSSKAAQRSAIPVLLATVLGGCAGTKETVPPEFRCEVATYRMTEGPLIDVGLSSEGYLRWRTMDGEVGRVARGDDGTWSGTVGWSEEPGPARLELGECVDPSIRVTGVEGVDGSGTQLDLEIQDLRFESAGEELAGRLVLPPGEGPVPLVVLVHGSEDSSALDYSFHQRLLPAQGIAVFVYDKRGTGASDGTYTQDFDVLARDAAAAHATALRAAGDRVGSSGYFGGSQGGWVAPLAATMSDADFVIAGFGLAEGPVAEERDEVQLRVRAAGYGEAELAKAREVTDATGRVLASDFKEGRKELRRVRRAYRKEPWFEHIKGGITGEMVVRPLWVFRMGYHFLDTGTPWDYEPLPVLRAVEVPALWVLGGEDRSTPPASTRAILTELQAEGLPIDVAFFPHADHGITRFVQDEAGERIKLGYAEGYHALVVDWIKTRRLGEAHGDAELAPRAAPGGDQRPATPRSP